MIFLFFLMSISLCLNAVHIDRVIVATNANPKYIQFWPIVAQAWTEIVGVRPTLILVAPKSVCVDETYGDVVYFEPLPHLPTSYQAQVIRLFAPILFPEDVCMISDIDMLPLQPDFIELNVKNHTENKFMSFWCYPQETRYQMTYNVAKGKIFGEIFDINWQQVPERLDAWHKVGFGWSTDEKMLTQYVQEWHAITQRFVFLDAQTYHRIERKHWKNDNPIALKNSGFFDADLPRPYTKYKQQIDELLQDLALSSRVDIIKPLKCDKQIIKNCYSAQECLITENEISALIKATDCVRVIDKYHSLVNLFDSPLFIHFLKANLQPIDYGYVRKLREILKFQQIAMLQIEFEEFSNDSKNTMKELLHLLGEYHYVLFKIVPQGIMHVPAISDLKKSYGQSKYIAFAPQYARGWSSLKSK